MKRLLLPLLAALALPTAVNAESYWLVLTLGDGGHEGASALEKIEMISMEACENEGEKWMNIRKTKDVSPKFIFSFFSLYVSYSKKILAEGNFTMHDFTDKFSS